MYPPRASGIGNIGAKAISRKNRRSSGQRFGSIPGARTNARTAAARVTALMKISTSRGRRLVNAKEKTEPIGYQFFSPARARRKIRARSFTHHHVRIFGPRILPFGCTHEHKESKSLYSYVPDRRRWSRRVAAVGPVDVPPSMRLPFLPP